MRRLALVLGCVAVLLALAAGLVLRAVQPEALVADAVRRLAAVGLDADPADDASLLLWPRPGVRVGGVQAQSAGGALRISAGTIDVALSPRGLLRGELSAGPIRLAGATLHLRDPRLAEPLVLTDATLAVALRGGALDVVGHGRMHGREATITAAVADIAAFSAGGPSTVALGLASGDDNARFAGLLALHPAQAWPQADGTIALALADLSAPPPWLAPALGPMAAPAAGSRADLAAPVASPAPPVPNAPSAVRALSAEAELVMRPDRLLLRGRASARAQDRTVSLDATLRGDPGWQQTGEAVAEVTARSGGLFSAHLSAAAGAAAGGFLLTGFMTLAVLDASALQDWARLDVAGWPEAGAARLSGELTISPGRADLSRAQLRQGAGEPAVGSIAIDLGSATISGSLGRGLAVPVPGTASSATAAAATVAAERSLPNAPAGTEATEAAGAGAAGAGAAGAGAAGAGAAGAGAAEAAPGAASVSSAGAAAPADLRGEPLPEGVMPPPLPESPPRASPLPPRRPAQ